LRRGGGKKTEKRERVGEDTFYCSGKSNLGPQRLNFLKGNKQPEKSGKRRGETGRKREKEKDNKKRALGRREQWRDFGRKYLGCTGPRVCFRTVGV